MKQLEDLTWAGDFARRVGVSPRYVTRECKAGRLPAVRLGRHWLIDETDPATRLWLLNPLRGRRHGDSTPKSTKV
jgi:excisionase family DNA binding protein